MQSHWKNSIAFAMTLSTVAALATGTSFALPTGDNGFGDWSEPVSAENGSNPMLNTAANDGCPILSPDGLSLYMASNRPGSIVNPATGTASLDIWVAHRSSTTEGWGAPQHLPEPINSAADDFCPTPVRGHKLFFVSKRDEPNGDIYLTRETRTGWEQPQVLGPNVNSADQEWSPSYFELENGTPVLYFSSTRSGNMDIYESVNWGPAHPVTELNTGASDARPNVRRDGKEIVFDTNRANPAAPPDIWTATRSSATGQWSPPHPVDVVNSPSAESRASLSWDGSYMVFGSSRPGVEGSADIFVTHRDRVNGAHGDD